MLDRHNARSLHYLFLLLALMAIGCDDNRSTLPVSADGAAGTATDQFLQPAPNPVRNAYFGDLHVHTKHSYDAFTLGTTATPDDAYRYARGEAIEHPWGYDLQLREPLDFYAVTDHALFLGLAAEVADPQSEIGGLSFARQYHRLNVPNNRGIRTLGFRSLTFNTFRQKMRQAIRRGQLTAPLLDAAGARAWQDIVRSADDNYHPGLLTTFAGFEFTSTGHRGGNLHRNVIFQATENLPALPFSVDDSRNPEDLWDWMDALRAAGVDSLAIPHNSNASNGEMFQFEDWSGQRFNDPYSAQRLRNEPLAEITQVKGTSDTHPLLSPEDEWSEFEIAPYKGRSRTTGMVSGSYIRQAYLSGMQMADWGTPNPYRFGLIGSSDSHVAATTDREDGYFSKSGLMDGRPFLRASVPLNLFEVAAATIIAPSLLDSVAGRKYFVSSSFETWSASGLAGVWAEENTRESLYAALRRKETFATTGPRIKLRVFAGFDYEQDMLQRASLLREAYAGGVPMGGEFDGKSARTPAFILWATRDVTSAPLQRLQVIKGFVRNGQPVERVFDAACAGGASVDPQTQRCPDAAASLDLETCSYDPDAGAEELLTLWQDPEFDAQTDAFYYVRVLENPTCRWSTWDAIREGETPRPDLPATIQERAWSSPIWYRAG